MYSTADQKSCTNDADSIYGSSRGVTLTNSRCFVLRACIRLLSSVFLASVHHPSHMAHATIAVLNSGPEGLFWNRLLLAVSARLSRIYFLHSGRFLSLIFLIFLLSPFCFFLCVCLCVCIPCVCACVFWQFHVCRPMITSSIQNQILDMTIR